MKITEIKKRMKAFRDAFGGDIFYDIDEAKTKKELRIILDNYITHLQDASQEAIRDVETFTIKLGL